MHAIVDHLYGPPEASGADSVVMPAEWHPNNRWDIAFTYGQSGYGECIAASVDRAFIAQHNLGYLLGVRDARALAAAKAAAAWTGPV